MKEDLHSPHDVSTCPATEEVAGLVGKQLQVLLQLVALETQGKMIETAGFRFKNRVTEEGSLLGEIESTTGHRDEHIWRFRLEGKPGAGGHADGLVEMTRQQFLALFEVCVLTYQGRRVQVDGFKFLKEDSPVFALLPDDAG